MNWSLGLFRLWVIGAFIWVGIFALAYAPDIIKEFREAYVPPGYTIFVPIDCTLANGVEGKDFTKIEPKSWETPGKQYCRVTEEKARIVLPQYKDYSRADLAETLTQEQGNFTPYPRPWSRLQVASIIVLVPPIALLMLGAALLWALRGFRVR